MKIAPTAKLANIKGSFEKRGEIAHCKTLLTIKKASDIFEKKGEITANELEEILQKQAPGLSIDIAKLSDSEYEGLLDQKLNADKTSVIGMILELPFVQKGKALILKKENVRTLIHEIRHMYDAATNPKYGVLSLKSFEATAQSPRDTKRHKKYEDFYYETLYALEADPMKTGKSEQLKNKINRLFFDEKTPQEERIKVLQTFRHEMKTELNAYTDELALGKQFGATYTKEDADLINELDFKDKIQTINELLAEELEEARFEHALKVEEKRSNGTYKLAQNPFIIGKTG